MRKFIAIIPSTVLFFVLSIPFFTHAAGVNGVSILKTFVGNPLGPNASAGVSTTVSLSIFNSSSTSIPNASYYIWVDVAHDGVQPSDTIKTGTITLPANKVSVPFASFTFPTSGPFAVGGCVTINGSSTCNASLVTIDAPKPAPDLTAGPLTINGTKKAGSILTFSGSVKNTGNATASGSFKNRFQIDINHNGNYETFVDVNSSNVAANSSKSFTSSGGWTAQAGTHAVRLCTDFPSPGSVAESNEGNNCGAPVVFTVAKVSTSLPDLTAGATTVSNFQFNSQTNKWQTTLTAPVKEISGKSVTKVFGNKFQIKSPNTNTWLDISLGTAGISNSLAVNGISGNGTVNVSVVFNQGGSESDLSLLQFRLCTDPLNDVAESNENNNCGDPGTGTTPGSRSITLTATPSTITKGGSTTLKWNNPFAGTTCTVTSPNSNVVRDANGNIVTTTDQNGLTNSLLESGLSNVSFDSSLKPTGSYTGALFIGGQGGLTTNTLTVSPTVSTTYKVVCGSTTGSYNSVDFAIQGLLAIPGIGSTVNVSNQASVTVNVPPAQPTLTFSAKPTSVPSGNSSTLTWTSTNANSCTGTNFSTGGKTNGSTSVAPTNTTTYKVTCSGAGGSVTRQATVTVTAKQLPDLIPASVAPTTAVAGQPTTLSFAVKNQGNVGTGTSFPNFIFVDDGGKRGIYDYPNDTAYNVTMSALSSNQTKTVSATHTFATSGTYTVGACTDNVKDWTTASVTESNENNNCLYSSITVSAAPAPDLTAGPLTINGTKKAGSILTFSGSVKNTGNATASGSFKNRFQIDINHNGNYETFVDVNSSNVAANSSKSFTSSGGWTAQAGTHAVRLCTDFPSPGSVAESNEGNNCGAPVVFTVADYPPITASCTGSPSTVTTGQAVTWSSQVSGGTGSYSYSWTGTDGLSGSTASVQKAYSTSGTKNASLTVTSGGQQATVQCTASNSGGGHGPGIVVTDPAPTATFTASPREIASGDSSTLTWTSTNATSCTGTGFSTGGRTSGSAQVSPTATSVYQLSCTGTGGSVVKNATVTVRNPNLSISADPVRVQTGKTSTITWSATDVNSCTVTGPNGFKKSGTGPAVSGSATQTITGKSTFVLSCDTVQGTRTEKVVVNVVPLFEEF